jgi:hypothetical protein
VLLLVVIAAFFVGQARHEAAASANASHVRVPGAITLVLGLILGGGVAYGVGKLIGFIIRLVGSSGFAEWHASCRPLECPVAGSPDDDDRRRHRHLAASASSCSEPFDVILPAAEQ